uniref:O-acyltransferase n=1 Tax=Kwoniella dejecticola CBS 10117 TaxID=1296121 RepID=A0A1A5ZUN2_9TREE|nr:sterol O-acyltransferase [Kwoniella dejecticola CBS 10117]OBR81520.1 sterol O-acyltransferase [Kwoniella dejecticola CBS 10117]
MVSTRSSSRPPDTPPALSSKQTTPPIADESVEMVTTLSKTKDNVINTPGGIIHVRPYRSSSNAQLKAVLSFTPRVSSLDRTNERSQNDQFRGFFVLFWFGLALLFLRTSMQSWEENRTPLSWTFGRLITGDALVLAISDLVMVLAMFFCVPFVKGLQYRWYKYSWTGLIIQHTFQTVYLGTAVWWGWHRQWYWVQSGFLVLPHAITPQMHSYMAHNGMLATVYFQLQEEKRQLDEVITHIDGGREQLLAEAAERKAQLEAMEGPTPVGTPGPGTPALTSRTSFSAPSGTSSGYEDPASILKKQLGPSAEIRQRTSTAAKKKKKNQATDSLPDPRPNLPLGTSLEPSHGTLPHERAPPSPLAWSSNEQVALLARNIDAMQEELISNGGTGLVWPQNVTYRHFLDFMFFPTLVYQLEYPRTKTMRPLVVLEKVVATLGTFSLIYTITEHYIMPMIPKPGDSLFKSFINLALPMMVNYLLIIFECVCTGFAELSYFADREFYQDWWNSTTWDEFSRKWNKPVYTFLLRHVYASTISGFRLSRSSAAFVTFFVSALCHELVMAVVTKKIRPYLFLMQMAQLPMIALGKLPAVKKNKTVGNIVFWMGLMSGFPLL